MLILILACAPIQLPEETATSAWTLRIASHFEQSGASRDWHLRGRLEAAPARHFRDGSHSTLLRFVNIEEAPTAEGPWLRAGLDGRSVEMRRFDDGQILDLAELHHLAGDPRHGDVLDLIFPALSPSPPAIGGGESKFSRSSWPFLLRKNVGWRSSLLATWQNQGFEGAGASRTAQLEYEGTLEATGRDDRFDLEYRAEGRASGSVLLETATGSLLRHELHWQRTVQAGSQQQEQSFELLLEATEASEWLGPTPRGGDDGTPLGNYLEPQDVHNALIPQLDLFETCYQHSGAAGRTEVGESFLEFSISPDGSVGEASIRDSRTGFPDLDACVAETAQQLSFPAHDEEPLHVAYPMLWMQSAIRPYPMVFVEERPVGQLFVMPL